jgi:hypothetical protein
MKFQEQETLIEFEYRTGKYVRKYFGATLEFEFAEYL